MNLTELALLISKLNEDEGISPAALHHLKNIAADALDNHILKLYEDTLKETNSFTAAAEAVRIELDL